MSLAILRCSFRQDVPIHDIIEGLIQRAEQAKNWTPAVKALIIIHKLLRDGAEVIKI